MVHSGEGTLQQPLSLNLHVLSALPNHKYILNDITTQVSIMFLFHFLLLLTFSLSVSVYPIPSPLPLRRTSSTT